MKMVFVFVLLFNIQVIHPIHVSVTEIEYDENERELEIMMRIFLDDLENAIRLHSNKSDLDILNPPQGFSTEKIVGQYIGSHLMINLDGKRQSIRYLGQEVEGEAVVCYLLVSNVKKWKSLEATNSILQELYDDQSNIVHVTVDETVKSMRLVKDRSSGSVSFEDQ